MNSNYVENQAIESVEAALAVILFIGSVAIVLQSAVDNSFPFIFYTAHNTARGKVVPLSE